MDHVVKRIDKCCDLSAIFTDLLNATFVPRSNRFILLMVKKETLMNISFSQLSIKPCNFFFDKTLTDPYFDKPGLRYHVR